MIYSVAFLPVAENDILRAVMLSVELNAPLAAANLVREIRKRVNALRDMPYRYQEYRSEPKRDTAPCPLKTILFFIRCWKKAEPLKSTEYFTQGWILKLFGISINKQIQ